MDRNLGRRTDRRRAGYRRALSDLSRRPAASFQIDRDRRPRQGRARRRVASRGARRLLPFRHQRGRRRCLLRHQPQAAVAGPPATARRRSHGRRHVSGDELHGRAAVELAGQAPGRPGDDRPEHGGDDRFRPRHRPVRQPRAPSLLTELKTKTSKKP